MRAVRFDAAQNAVPTDGTGVGLGVGFRVGLGDTAGLLDAAGVAEAAAEASAEAVAESVAAGFADAASVDVAVADGEAPPLDKGASVAADEQAARPKPTVRTSRTGTRPRRRGSVGEASFDIGS